MEQPRTSQWPLLCGFRITFALFRREDPLKMSIPLFIQEIKIPGKRYIYIQVSACVDTVLLSIVPVPSMLTIYFFSILLFICNET